MTAWRQKLACLLIHWRSDLRVFRPVPVVDANEEFNTDDGKMATATEFFYTERGGVYYIVEVESLLLRAG